jgi:hypothetical protein
MRGPISAFRSAGSWSNSSSAFGWMPMVLLMMNSSRARPMPALGVAAKAKARSGLPTFIITLTGTSGIFSSSMVLCSKGRAPCR